MELKIELDADEVLKDFSIAEYIRETIKEELKIHIRKLVRNELDSRALTIQKSIAKAVGELDISKLIK